MFIFTEAGYQLFRAKGRSILLLCVSALLCGCMTFYIGNITSAQAALNKLSETDPVNVRVVNYNGTRTRDLMIRAERADKVFALPVHDVRATSQAQLGSGNDACTALAVTCPEAAGFSGEAGFDYLDGYDSAIFQGDGGVCVVTSALAQERGIRLGDSLTLPAFQLIYSGGDEQVLRELGVDIGLEVVGIVSAQPDKSFRADIYMPIAPLRAAIESVAKEVQTGFYYNTMEFRLNDSMALGDIKNDLSDIGFYHPTDPSSGVAGAGASLNKVDGNTLIFEDEYFIKTAERLGEKRKQFMDFIIPFFLVVVLLVTLAILLVLRGARRDMAIAVSLGRPKPVVGLMNLIAALAAELVGCLIAMPVAGLLSGIGAGVALIICGAFMLCAVAGDIVGLLGLLRFDTLRLLIETE